MPKFCETEKQKIKAKLFTEGERLFAAYGLKKVSIDELAASANIAKATFYTFYDNKELLYLDIVQSIQLNIFQQLEGLLVLNKDLKSSKRVLLVFSKMYELMQKYPILSQIDKGTAEIISRKVEPQHLKVFYGQNVDAVNIMIKHGVRFLYSAQVVSDAFLAVYHGFIALQSKDVNTQKRISDILLNGVIAQIVSD